MRDSDANGAEPADLEYGIKEDLFKDNEVSTSEYSSVQSVSKPKS